ncbi:MAG TPA: SNF2-related protein [Gemmatimonadaceae bacterium]|nr:SNF2-related protein [Gemmatimonadaceae bacterium]
MLRTPAGVSPFYAMAAPEAIEELWTLDEQSLADFVRRLDEPPSSVAWAKLRREAELVALAPGFDRLITLDANTIKELPHQIDVARRVLRQMGGRAILADEVGLGKTIEAGIILKELTVRGLARRVLILTPASLVTQWQGELETKFFERFDTPTEPEDWTQATRAIVSYDRAIGQRHGKAILRHRWDLVIIDEAHKVKNHAAARYKFIQRLDRNYLLLLTATPLQNDLRELYNLVTLLRPGQLGTWREFKSRHLTGGDKRTPKDADALKELTSQVMVRTRRSSVAIALELPPRRPVHPTIALTPRESALYEETAAFLRELYREGFVAREDETTEQPRRKRRTGKGVLQLELMRLSQRLCSSAAALSVSLNTLSQGELLTPKYRLRARELAADASRVKTHAKLKELERVLSEDDDRLIVFSEHLPTLDLIAKHVKRKGRTPIVYSGALSLTERAKKLAAFKEDPSAIFVATRAGTEGLNLQFCNRLVNYELPWNPMVVEQRIGRIHRIGQTREAHIINFAARDTVEAHVLRLLDQKIKLFELVIGELDVILGDFGGADSLEERLAEAWLGAESDDAFNERVEAIGEQIVASREAGKRQEELNSDVASEDNAQLVERDFDRLVIPARVRLAFGTNHLLLAPGVDAKRRRIGLHVAEIQEALEQTSEHEDKGTDPEYGSLVLLSGVTGSGRAVHLTVNADKLPMTLVDVDADAAPGGRS